MSRRAATSILCLFCPLFLLGQYYYLEHLGPTQGLPSEETASLLSTPDGYLWLGTRLGLFRYDSYEFTPIPLHYNNRLLSNPRIEMLIPAEDSRFFIVFANQGFAYYTPSSNEIELFQEEFTQLPGNQIEQIIDDEGQAWLLIDRLGIARFDKCDYSFQLFRPSHLLPKPARDKPRADELINISQDPNQPHLLWLSSVLGLASFNKKNHNMRLYPGTPDAPQPASNSFRQLVVDRNGILYASTWKNGVFCFDTRKEKWLGPLPGNEKNGLSNVAWLSLKSPDELWVADGSLGLFEYNAVTRQLRLAVPSSEGDSSVSSPNYLLSRWPTDMVQGPNGTWWIAQDRNGVSAIYPVKQQFRRYHLPAYVQCAAQAEGSKYIYFTTKMGTVYRFNEKTGKSTPISTETKRGDSYLFRHCGCDERGKFWMVGKEALYYYDSARNMMVPHDIPALEDKIKDEGKWLLNAMKDSRGQYWFTTNRGLLRCAPGSSETGWYVFTHEDNGTDIPWHGLSSLMETGAHRIWFASDRGFGFTDDNGKTFLQYGPESPRSRPSELISLSAIAKDGKGRIWVGSRDNGLGYVYDSLPHPQEIQLIGAKEGLLNEQVEDLEVALNGDLWVLGRQGLSRINKDNLQIENFGTGYEKNLVEPAEISLLPDGRMALGSSSGFYLFQPSKLYADTTFFPVYLQEMEILGQPFLSEKALNSLERILLSYEQQDYFSFFFTSPKFSATGPISYQYMLENFDNNWKQAGEGREAAFTKVGYGEFVFKLRGSNAQGQYSEQNIRELAITIDRPFYLAWWFLSLLAMLFVGIVTLIAWREVRRFKKEQQLKAAFDKKVAELEMQALLAQMNPHFLFNSLQSIKWYLINHPRAASAAYIDKFSSLLRKTLKNTRSKLISLAEELEALELYIQLEQYRFSEKFDYRIVLAPEIAKDFVRIPPLLLQPFVENAIWHGLMHLEGRRGQLSIIIEKKGEGIRACIEDNGLGREEAGRKFPSSHHSVGLELARSRLEAMERQYQIKAELKIVDLVDEKGQAAGTRAVVCFSEVL